MPDFEPFLMRLAPEPAPVLSLRVARGFLGRLLGLWAVPFGPGHDGLLIQPCWAIHTFGLRQPIDVVFLDARGRVLNYRRNLAPNRVAGAWGARQVIELPGGFCLGLKDRHVRGIKTAIQHGCGQDVHGDGEPLHQSDR